MSIGSKGLALLCATLFVSGLAGAGPVQAQQASKTGRTAPAPATALPRKAESKDTKAAKAAIAQREKLQEARLAIAQNDQRRLKQLKRELKDYPLLPYIDYWAISKKLSRLPYEDIDAFLDAYDGTAIGDWMRIRVLRELGSRERFRAYLKYYRPEQIQRTQLRCYYVDALSRHGDKQEAYKLIEELWTVGASQPKECDPAFSRWMSDGGLTQDRAWKRHALSVRSGNLDLASYIARSLDKGRRGRAELMRSVYREPDQILDFDRFTKKNPEYRDIVTIGLRRLASRDAEKTSQAWQRYSASYLFSDEERDEFLRYLALQFARQDDQQGLETLIRSNPGFFDLRTSEWLIRQSLREMDWAQVEFWIDQLPQDDQSLDRWLYWRARAISEQLAASGKKDPARIAQMEKLYQKAAAERSYYGFLASDTLGKDYSFVDRPAPITPELVDKVAALPGMQRAEELQAIGEFYHARREWDYATDAMSTEELMTAGKVASAWGWYHKSIQSILAADYLDDLELRFPLAFSDIVSDVAGRMGKKTALDSYLVLAVARQESHFSHDAKSHAGAMGLMQLLPSTARATARKAGVPYRRSWDLLNPSTNISLGAYYLNSLLNRFDNNRFLAAAAYNAGPTRVSHWLKDTNKKLPFDVWIETIPYSETRKYVQNVLSYSVIYAYRSGDKAQLLRKNEAEAKL
ncbi:transglycosylase SLT domain-containing protein [Microbulbifer hydrolyticus]|uniref:Soluble lytic murein transglycosylase n=1 Tax=Microbulbifer hydrolyticus TaxID=48074 RepID=A0A6P1T826_9GAMM|nr:transglycosylase SLT domain-containing protein [Microbulbifer hydrolyticus]MBB5210579.1 soluble lytic murein transglycosylase [Microbulbifer hydrolyticus]QHQ38954.1 transglycosylase SLT domain-containing protein [Microbulbifer hydrolyticus]